MTIDFNRYLGMQQRNPYIITVLLRDKMKTRAKIILIVVLLAGVAIFWASQSTVRSQQAVKKAQEKVQTPEDFEYLKALPYTQWSDTKGNEKQRGVSFYDKKLAYPGYNLYTNDEDEVYLTDMNGKRVNTWHIPGKYNCEYAQLLDDGNLVVVCANQAIVKVDWMSKPIWEHDFRVHHDVAMLPDGSYLTLLREMTDYKSQPVVFDSIIHVSPEGKILSRWNTADKIHEIARFHPPHPMEAKGEDDIRKTWKKQVRIDYYHMNTIQVLPATELGKRDHRFQAGNLLVCFRNVSLVAILDRDTMNIVWTWGPGVVQMPHMPTMLPDSHILIYDNGSQARPYTRIVELEPVSKRIVWEYKANPPESFFSHWQGSAQRLPNGNTLICESTKALVFEVTKEGKTVWRFWSPEVKNTRRKRIYRFMRLPKDKVDRIRAKLDQERIAQ
jgi:hypothetical protein